MIYADSERLDRRDRYANGHNLPPNFVNLTYADVPTRPRRRVGRRIVKGAGIAVGGLFVLGLIGGMIDKAQHPNPRPIFQPTIVTTEPSLPPCPGEDAVGPCVWDGSKQGNGVGGVVTNDPNKPVEPVPPHGDALWMNDGVLTLGAVPHGRECVLMTADGKSYLTVSDTDPMCSKWWANGPTSPPATPPFDPIKEALTRK